MTTSGVLLIVFAVILAIWDAYAVATWGADASSARSCGNMVRFVVSGY